MTNSGPLETGQSALARGEWPEAQKAFESALANRESPEALEGLGWALWWQDRIQPSFEAREKAYRLYSEGNDALGAARVATALALDIYDYQGRAVTNGWLKRAHRHLEGLEPAAEHGWLALWEGHLARLVEGDVAAARRSAEEAAAIGRTLGIKDLEMLAIALEGYVLVSEGKVDAGMQHLDEATAAAMAGEISDLDAAGAACCFLMHACEQVRDLDRATQWADRVAEFSRRWRIRPLYAICRVHYGVVLTGRGDWSEAEAVFQQVLEEISATHGPARSEAVLHLAELRRRQGRNEEAASLFSEVEDFSLSLIGRALLALDRGDAATAVAFLTRSLRRVSEDNWTVRAVALKNLSRAQVLTGDSKAAAQSLEGLQAIADLVRTPYVLATARQASGCWLGEAQDAEAARHAFEDAVDLYEASHAPFEASRARLDLARLLFRANQPDLARAEAEAALEVFLRLGAKGEVERVREFLAEAAGGTRPEPAGEGPLTRREIEVLALVAEGLGDKEMASRLHLSEHTVHRHVSNILQKLEAPSRAAAVALGIRLGLI